MKRTKLNDLGTTGLIDYVNTGSARTRGMRYGKACKVLFKRNGKCSSTLASSKLEAFTRIVDEEWERQ